jgi:hypothetical protein
VTSLWHREWSLEPAERAALLAMDGGHPSAAMDAEATRLLLRKGFIHP